jgi:hypothetical protein
LVKLTLPQAPPKQERSRRVDFSFALNKAKLRLTRRREGRYLLRSNMSDTDSAKLWELYLQLGEVKTAFKQLKGNRAVRPIYHQRENRIEAHIFVAFIAYCIQVTLKHRLRLKAPGLTARQALDKFSTRRDARCAFPDHRWPGAYLHPIYRTRTRPTTTLGSARLDTTATTTSTHHCKNSRANVVQTFWLDPLKNKGFSVPTCLSCESWDRLATRYLYPTTRLSWSGREARAV